MATNNFLKNKSPADLDNLRDADVLAEEIAEILECVLASFRDLLRRLKGQGSFLA